MRLHVCILAAVAALAVVPTDSAALPDGALIARGKYLATAADCGSCHSMPGRLPFTGGNAFRTPFGTIYSSNITADRKTGIGAWSDAEFLRALRQGIGKSGEQLYPAFPYAEFTGLSDRDGLAIKAYLLSLPAAEAWIPQNAMRFPFGNRATIRAWKLVNFRDSRFVADPSVSAAVNRGRFLAGTLAHCNECHTPRNMTMGLDNGHALAGGTVDGWQAYNITPDRVSGIGRWTSADIVSYLSSGDLKGHAEAAGPMAEVIENSLRFLSRDDLEAIALYLKSVPAARGPEGVSDRTSFGRPDPDRLTFSAAVPDPDHPVGRSLYAFACASCHGLDGRGLPGRDGRDYPPLIGNSITGAPNADNLVQTILHGAYRRDRGGIEYMPPFDNNSRLSNALSDDDVAALANYLVRQFGDPAAATMTADHVARLRRGDAASTLADVTELALGGLALAIGAGALIFWRRRERSS